MDEEALFAPLGDPPSGWSLRRVSSFAEKVGSGATPRGGQASYLPERLNFALIRSQNIYDRRFSPESLAFISDEAASKLKGVHLQSGDVLLNITGDGVTFARAALVPDDILPACVNQHVSIIRTDPVVCDPGFLLSYLVHPQVKKYIESFNTGGSRRAVTKGYIESFVVPLPPLPTQRRIASILSAYDDLIENNTKRIEILEEMARSLYREWFVHFRFPGHEQVKLVDSELGKIPEGWRCTTLGQVADVFDGPHATPKPADAGPIFLGIKNITENGLLDLSQVRHIAENEFARWTKRVTPSEGDIVFTYEASLHRYSRIPRGFHGCLGRRTALVRPKSKSVDARYLLPLFLSRPWFELMESNKLSGATVDRISVGKFPSFQIVIPSDEVMAGFVEFSGDARTMIEVLTAKNEVLRQTRDLLLPKLISGEIDVDALDLPEAS